MFVYSCVLCARAISLTDRVNSHFLYGIWPPTLPESDLLYLLRLRFDYICATVVMCSRVCALLYPNDCCSHECWLCLLIAFPWNVRIAAMFAFSCVVLFTWIREATVRVRPSLTALCRWRWQSVHDSALTADWISEIGATCSVVLRSETITVKKEIREWHIYEENATWRRTTEPTEKETQTDREHMLGIQKNGTTNGNGTATHKEERL